jgi:hypothetical protein
LGITDQGSIVSSQNYIQGNVPSQDGVDAFLELSGLVPVKRQFWLWKKVYPGFEIWVGNARKDNFVDTETEVVPIDIRVWFVDTPQATAME